MKKYIKQKSAKQGFTLIELVVAMAIFLVIITLALGAFVTVSRMKSLTSTMKEVQQKTRIATEMIIRLSRQADKVVTSSGESSYVDLYYNLKNTNPDYANRFEITGAGELMLFDCQSVISNNCSDWGSGDSILGSSVKLNQTESFFKKTGTIPPHLEVRINGIVSDVTNSPYYSNEIIIDTNVILESIK